MCTPSAPKAKATVKKKPRILLPRSYLEDNQNNHGRGSVGRGGGSNGGSSTGAGSNPLPGLGLNSGFGISDLIGIPTPLPVGTT